MLTNERLESLTEAMHRLVLARDSELQRLCLDPNRFAIAQALTDDLWDSLAILCDYSHAIEHDGKRVGIDDLKDQLQESIRESFRRMTGREYVPEICRRRKGTS